MFFSYQASEQMKVQAKRSSSIIVALTDGKLEPYIHQLTKDEVSWYQIKEFKGIVHHYVVTVLIFHRISHYLFLYLNKQSFIQHAFLVQCIKTV